MQLDTSLRRARRTDEYGLAGPGRSAWPERRKQLRLTTAVLPLLLSCAQNAAPHADSIALQSTAAFKVAYGLSYQIDACGDQATGQAFRNALVERFLLCPFSADARTGFRQWTTETDDKAAEQIRQLAEYGQPDRLAGMTRACREELSSRGYDATRDRLAKYSRVEIDIRDVFPGECSVAPSFP